MITTVFKRDRLGRYVEMDLVEVLDYSIDHAGFLGDDTLIQSAWSASPGITLSSPSTEGAVTTAWLSGAAPGVVYWVANTITTVGGRTRRRAFRVVGRAAVA